MHGTVILMMALSGLGCHNKSCGSGYSAAPVSACSTGCDTVGSGYYASSQVGYIDSCNSGCGGGNGYAGYTPAYGGGMYDASYAGACYGSYESRGCFGIFKKRNGGGLFSCFKKNRGCYAPTSYGCDAGVYDSSYSTPVFGSYTPSYLSNEPVYSSSQVYGSGPAVGSAQYTTTSVAPAAEVATPVPPAPAADAAPIPPAPAVDPTAPVPAAEAVPAAPAPGA